MKHVTGLENVLKNLNTQILGIENRSRAGLVEAAIIVKTRSMELCPVDTGNLRASAYYRTYSSGHKAFGPTAEIGHRASYAVYVHEIDATHKQGQWKFLETALKEKEREVLDAIRRRAYIP